MLFLQCDLYHLEFGLPRGWVLGPHPVNLGWAQAWQK